MWSGLSLKPARSVHKGELRALKDGSFQTPETIQGTMEMINGKGDIFTVKVGAVRSRGDTSIVRVEFVTTVKASQTGHFFYLIESFYLERIILIIPIINIRSIFYAKFSNFKPFMFMCS